MVRFHWSMQTVQIYDIVTKYINFLKDKHEKKKEKSVNRHFSTVFSVQFQQ